MGSNLLLLDETCESSAICRVGSPDNALEGCGVTIGSTRSAGGSCVTGAVVGRRECTWAREGEGGLPVSPDERKNGSRVDGT